MQLKVTLKKSTIGCPKDQIGTVHALGLHKIGQVTVQPDNEATRGKISHIGYLLQVTEEK